MHKVRVVLLTLMAVSALSAVASSTASAATHQWIIEGTPLAEKSTQEIQGNGQQQQQQQFETTILGLNIHLQCQSYLLPSGSSNVFEGGIIGKAKIKIEFTGCAVFQVTSKGASEPLPTCKIAAEPIVAEGEGEMKEAGILTFKEIGGVPFSKFSIEKTNKEATCAAATKVEVKGTLVCPIPHFGVSLYAHQLLCAPGGSSLTTSLGEPARLYLPGVMTLEKGGKYSST